MKAEASEKRTEEYLDSSERTESAREGGGHEQAATSERMDAAFRSSGSARTGSERQEERSRAIPKTSKGTKTMEEEDEEDEEAGRRKTVRFLRKLEREEKQNMVSEIAEVEVYGQKTLRLKRWTNMLEKLIMFEFGSWQEATTRVRKFPTNDEVGVKRRNKKVTNS